MANLPPLHLYLLAHPKSDEANAIAADLMRRFVEPPASGGLRIPVFFTPDRGDDLPPALDGEGGINLCAAQHTIVVVLGDERMVRTVPEGAGDAWVDFVRDALAQTPVGASPHHTLPVALDQAGFQLSGEHHVLPALLKPDMAAPEAAERRLVEISFHIAARAIQLLEHGKVPELAPGRMKAPVQMFVSHAKADLAADRQDPVRQTRDLVHQGELPIDQWYDAEQIAPGQKFADAIRAGAGDCSIMLAFHTDHYGSRPWCRREVLEAKERGVHILIVDALESGEPRSFPYAGNVPVIRWQFRDPRVDAGRVIDRAVLEALRFKYNRAMLEAISESDEVVLPAPPEAVTLAYPRLGEKKGKVFLYPDPPLGREELELLQRLRPKLSFVTPLTKIAQWPRPKWIDTITVSISESDDLRRYGLSTEHFDTLSDEIHLYLLLAGLKIAYGGALQADFTKGSNFTLRLFELVRAYSGLAEGVGSKPLKEAILNVAPWPLYLGYGEGEWKLFSGKVAKYQPAPRPDLPWNDDEVFPVTDGRRTTKADTPQRRYAWARGLTAMRERITEDSQARLVLGGKLRGFSGLVPGVVEEAWLSLRNKHPLFVAGGFGGAARAVGDLLLGKVRPEFSGEWPRQTIADYDASRALYDQHGGDFVSLEHIGRDLRDLRATGLQDALNNGLDEAENEELILSTNPQQIAGLVLRGLGRLSR
ncbi:TIR domain-containing protein [Thiocapsa rosea]|uniref:TIR domain-containing protein n=1 Tax=Thiocapsa rosea TaxID=69360 RepID=A0A495VBC6_9GAMM|nr:TIR domain-containing protein [Thiocapsa rosea]RKT46639.1 TIR domain-containing protein [Thiocapsa rosea]